MDFIHKISISISLIGIIILLIIANILQPSLKEIKDINIKNLNKKIKINGILKEIKSYDNLQILTITQDSFYIDVLVNEKIKVSKGEKLLITGKIIKYKNNLEIQADKIIL